MSHDGRRTRIVAIGGRTSVIAHLAVALAQQKIFVLVAPDEGTNADLRAAPVGLWSPPRDIGLAAHGIVHGPQRKGRGGKIKRW